MSSLRARLGTVQLPPYVQAADEAAVLRYLEKVAESWKRMEAAGITRIDHRSRGRALAAERDWAAEAEQCALLRHQAS